MPKITAYTVVSVTKLSDLKESVERHLNEGWQPLGGVAALIAGYFQALVKYEG